MLTVLQHHLENPEDIPAIPHASAQFLKARLNPAYLMRLGTLDDLRRAGFSEAAILGFLEGVTAATEVIEQMEEAQRQAHEDEQLT
jgi:hypothetical protein